MELVQLIEKVRLKDGLWMTFWDPGEKARLSLEVRKPVRSYTIGEVFQLNKSAQYENLALVVDFDRSKLATLDLPLQVPGSSKLKQRIYHFKRRFTYVEPLDAGPTVSELGGMVYVENGSYLH